MTSFEDRIGLAMSLGLSRYEARTYLALLELGEAKASRVTAASKVPRGRIYEVLDSLQEKGLVAIVPSTPRRYRAISPSSFVQARKMKLRAQAHELERSAKRLTSLPRLRPRDLPGPTGDFLLLRKRPVVMGRMREMIEGAQEEILISSTEACTVRSRKVHLASFQAAARAGVDTRISVNITKDNLDAVQALAPFVQLRHNDLGNRGVTVLVVDREQALMCHWNPDDTDPFVGDDSAVWSNDRSVAESFRATVLATWEQGVDFDIRARGIRTGEPPERTEFITGRDELARIMASIARSPHDEIWATTLSSAVRSHYREYLPFVKEAASPKGRLRMLVGHDGGGLDVLWEFERCGVEIRITPSVDLGRHLIVDRSEALSFIWPRGSKPSDLTGTPATEVSELVVRTTVKDVVRTLSADFESEWSRAIPLVRYEGVSQSMAAD